MQFYRDDLSHHMVTLKSPDRIHRTGKTVQQRMIAMIVFPEVTVAP